MLRDAKLPDKILWLGPYAVGEYFDTLLDEKTYVQTAANRVEGYYINEIYAQTKVPIDIISALITQPYPASPRKKIDEDNTRISDNIMLYNVPFINRPYLSVVSQKKSLKKRVQQWCKENQGKNVWVIIYSMRLPLLKCVNIIKNNFSDAKVINIIPDLPQYMRGDTAFLRQLAMESYKKRIWNAQKGVDLFSIYTEKMKDYLPCEKKDTIVVEGLFDGSNLNKKPRTQSNKGTKIVLYAGGLSEQYGLDILVEAFRFLENKGLELHVYGQGSYLNRLQELEQELPNVKYKGFVSPEQAFEKICEADLVVNPRPSSPEYTKYSVPSKIFEYMASGTPVLMTRLPGVLKEYFNYVYVIEEETTEGIAKAIEAVFEIDEQERIDMANRAADFILKEKSAKNQVGRLINAVINLR